GRRRTGGDDGRAIDVRADRHADAAGGGANARARDLKRRANAMGDDLDFPYRFDGRGRTATTDRVDHIRDLIEQVLFTAPGERVMRPDFGSGLLALVFEPNSTTLAATTQMLVQSALQQHLSHLIAVQAVEVTNDDP